MVFQSRRILSFFLVALLFSLVTSSCKQIDVYEKDTSIPHFKWQHNFAAEGTFIISDTLSGYNIYIVLRHTDAYKYNNIWLNVGLKSPGDSMFFQKVNLTLASDATGWEGTGMNDIWEVRKLLNAEPRRFKKGGEYKFSITQVMRDNPLPDVMSAGLRLKKAN
jgi:gliding motility-associated lipoprotein GldH